MATPEFKTLDQLRTRLQQLSASINLFRHELESAQQLPSWPALQTASSNLASTLQNLAQILASNRSLLSSAHAYPNPTFPAHSQESFLQQLLRKKLDPKAEDWMDQELDKQPDVEGEDRGELWQWAGGIVKEMRADLEEGLWSDFFTMEERKAGVRNVQTGIKRQLYFDDEDDEGEGEDDGEDGEMEEDSAVSKEEVEKKMKNLPPPIPLETLLRYATGSVSLPGRPKT